MIPSGITRSIISEGKLGANERHEYSTMLSSIDASSRIGRNSAPSALPDDPRSGPALVAPSRELLATTLLPHRVNHWRALIKRLIGVKIRVRKYSRVYTAAN